MTQCHVKVDIYFTDIDLFERPTEQELQTPADMHEQNADKPGNGKGVALLGLLQILYIKYFLIHP